MIVRWADVSDFFSLICVCKMCVFVSRPMKFVTFLRKNDYSPKRDVDFPLERDTFRNKIMEIVEDFAFESIFFLFLSFFIIFLHFFVFFHFFHFFHFFIFFHFFHFFIFYIFSFFIFFNFSFFFIFLSFSFIF